MCLQLLCPVFAKDVLNYILVHVIICCVGVDTLLVMTEVHSLIDIAVYGGYPEDVNLLLADLCLLCVCSSVTFVV